MFFASFWIFFLNSSFLNSYWFMPSYIFVSSLFWFDGYFFVIAFGFDWAYFYCERIERRLDDFLKFLIGSSSYYLTPFSNDLYSYIFWLNIDRPELFYALCLKVRNYISLESIRSELAKFTFSWSNFIISLFYIKFENLYSYNFTDLSY